MAEQASTKAALGLIRRQGWSVLDSAAINFADFFSRNLQRLAGLGSLLGHPGQQGVTGFNRTVDGHFSGKLKWRAHEDVP